MANHSTEKKKEKKKRKSSLARYIINPLEGNVLQHDDCLSLSQGSNSQQGSWRNDSRNTVKTIKAQKGIKVLEVILSVLDIDLFRCNCLF